MRVLVSVVLVSIVLTSWPGFAKVPNLMVQQGVLRNSAGEPVSGQYDLTFTLYSSLTGGAPLWKELALDLDVKDGVFGTLVGMQTPLPPALFAQYETLWMEVQVEKEPPLPRQRLTAVPYAFEAAHALTADTLTGEAANVACSGCVDGADLASNLVFLSVRNQDGIQQFAVTNAAPGLEVAGAGSVKVSFDAAKQRITIGAEDAGGTVTNVQTGSGLTGGPITTSGTVAIAPGGVTGEHVASSFEAVSVRDGTGKPQFSITRGAPGLQLVGQGSASVSFDAASQRVVIGAADSGGDITAVTAGPGLSGGGIAGDVSLALAAPTASTLGGVRSGACTGTDKVAGVDGTGGLTCAADQDTKITAGAGLALKTGELSIAAGGVTNAMLQQPGMVIAAGAGLMGGGAVDLGGAVTLGLSVPVAVAHGGTGAGTAAAARTNLGAAASGANADIAALLGLQGQEAVVLRPYATTAGGTSEMRFHELTTQGVQYVGFKAPDSVPTSTLYTLPAAPPGASGEVLASSASGVLSWTATATGSVTQVGTGAGLTGGPITTSGTISIASGGVSNAMLANPSLTITPGAGLSGGGTVALGNATTLGIQTGGVTNAMLQSSAVTVSPGTGLTGGGSVSLGGSTSIGLANTAVAPGSYTRANVTVDAQGRLTSASSGAALNLGSEVTGILAVSNGGTGASTTAAARASLGAAASGDNTDIASLTGLSKQNALEIDAYGTGAGNTGELRFRELAAEGTAYVAIKGPDALAASVVYTLPAAKPANGQVLSGAADGALSWSTPLSGTVTQVGTGAGLTGGPVTTSGTIAVAPGGVTNAMLQHSTVGVTAGAGLSGGNAAIPLGGSASLALPAVAAQTGTFARATVTVDTYGRVTSASGGPVNLALTADVTGTLPVANGGTGSSNAAGARTNLGAAASGDNSDITSLTGLDRQVAIEVDPFGTSPGNTGEIRLRELSATGTNYVGLKAPDAISTNLVYTLPAAPPATGQVLSAASGGLLSWTTPLAGTVTQVSTGTGLTGGPITTSGTLSLAPSGVSAGTYNRANVTVDTYGRITSASSNVTVNVATEVSGLLAVANGGTGASSAASARTNLGAAASGVNSDITSLTGLNQQVALQVGPYGTAAGNTGEIRFRELAAGGTQYVGLRAPDALAANLVYTLPATAPASGQVLSGSASGALSWSTPLSGTVTGISAGTPGAQTGTSGLTFSSNPIESSGSIAIANGGVTSAHILDGTIATGDIAGSAVTSGLIADGAVTNADINDATTNLSVQNYWGSQQFTVTDGSQGLRFASGSGLSATFTSANHTVTYTSTGVLTVGASGVLSSTGGQNPSVSLSGVVPTANGGTGLSAPGSAGNYLRSNGTSWTTSAIQKADVPPRGVVYTRWGRTNCPTDATLVYDGYAAGKAHNHGGGGANTLCMTKSPTWLNYSDNNQNGALIYGMEYEMSGYGLWGVTPFNGLHDYNAPCAVCLQPDADLVLMHPGSHNCPAGWTERYEGYLMATHYTHGASEFVCVDATAQGIGSAANQDGNLWYPTEAECGSLPCGPYVDNRELACSVCTK